MNVVYKRQFTAVFWFMENFEAVYDADDYVNVIYILLLRAFLHEYALKL